MIKNNQTYYYHADGLGSIVAITDSAGLVVQRYEYDSFGVITYIQDPNFKQSYTYTGREYDNESGLYYYRARYYDPKIGRFISEDPIGLEGEDVNFYAYVGNSPINWIDPLGLYRIAPGAGEPVDARTEGALTCFESCLGSEVTVTGARESGRGHRPGSAHETGQACDLGKNNNPDLNRSDVERCFNQCTGPNGFVWGYEGTPNFHFQTRPGSGGATGFAPGVR